jgi:hypothetical protein
VTVLRIPPWLWLGISLAACAPSDFDRATQRATPGHADAESSGALSDSSAGKGPDEPSHTDAAFASDAGELDADDAEGMMSSAKDAANPDDQDARAEAALEGGGADAASPIDADAGPSCQSFELDCHGRCIDPSSDSVHCGRCDQPCTANETCLDGACANVSGCSDGTREAFVDVHAFPTIAGCAAGWSLSSMAAAPTGQRCGNGLALPCLVPADACAAGWHVCGLRGPRELSDRVTRAECVTPPGRFAAAISDHHCDECGNGFGYGAVCCGASCWVEGGTCVWPDATPWFGLDANRYIMACAAIHNPLPDSQGALCCHDGTAAALAPRRSARR